MHDHIERFVEINFGPDIEVRAIPGYTEYFATSTGQLISTKRWRGIAPPRVLNPYIRRDGYGQVNLYANGTPAKILVHAAVLAAFVGPRPSGREICHRDGNPANNHVDNLYYGTPAENTADTARHGRHRHGAAHHSTKFGEDTVREILELRKQRLTYKKIAKSLLLPYGTVSNILQGYNWSRFTGIPRKYRPPQKPRRKNANPAITADAPQPDEQ